jgi:hypothetical protein
MVKKRQARDGTQSNTDRRNFQTNPFAKTESRRRRNPKEIRGPNQQRSKTLPSQRLTAFLPNEAKRAALGRGRVFVVHLKITKRTQSLPGSQISEFQISDWAGSAVPNRRYRFFSKRSHSVALCSLCLRGPPENYQTNPTDRFAPSICICTSAGISRQVRREFCETNPSGNVQTGARRLFHGWRNYETNP